MNILVINGDCIQRNSSANLCHLAYINGLLQLGHKVSLLSASAEGYEIDSNMAVPEGVIQYTYPGMSLYERISIRKNKSSNSEVVNNANKPNKENQTEVVSFLARVKKKILDLYGVHGIYATFVRKARRFSSKEYFDYVISLSAPTSSHLLAYKLIKSKRIVADHWIQIWEDPWYVDAYGFNGKDKIRKEEQRLLSYAERICYVSPLTLINQQRMFKESAHKMFWQPLPTYYYDVSEQNNDLPLCFGYFGNYVPASRDLEPFYTAAVQVGINVNICGTPSDLFASTDNIKIYPRLTLDKLKPIEDSTNVLVFLCNRKGGQIPGKIYQYSATSKTILFILDGTEDEKQVLRDYFGKYNRYVFCENNVESIKEAIDKIKNNNLDGVSNEPLNCFSPDLIVDKILKME